LNDLIGAFSLGIRLLSRSFFVAEYVLLYIGRHIPLFLDIPEHSDPLKSDGQLLIGHSTAIACVQADVVEPLFA